MRRCSEQRAVGECDARLCEGERRRRCGGIGRSLRAIADVERERRRDLVVAAAPRMQARSGLACVIANARVDRTVNVFRARGACVHGERPVGDLTCDAVQRTA